MSIKLVDDIGIMLVSQKCQYVLGAIFELARRMGEGPIKISHVAQAEAIPARFLDVILSQLKQGGFVTSQRGVEGGYQLAKSPAGVSVGEVIRFVRGPIGPVGCLTADAKDACPLEGKCGFMPVWQKVHDATASAYDSRTSGDLVDQDQTRAEQYVPCYAI